MQNRLVIDSFDHSKFFHLADLPGVSIPDRSLAAIESGIQSIRPLKYTIFFD